MDIVITDGKSQKCVSVRTWELLQERKGNKWQRISRNNLSGDVVEFLNSRSQEKIEKKPPEVIETFLESQKPSGIKQRKPGDIPLSITKIKENLVNYSKDDLLADSRKGVNALAELK